MTATESMPVHALLSCGDLEAGSLEDLFGRFGLAVVWVEEGAKIPGCHWGEPEAGILRGTLFVRRDTPVHSALHEGCHLICADSERRAAVDTDIGGDHAEENAVCYLQILLADHLPGFGRDRAAADMDAWGYTFRLGSAKSWFEEDAADALAWLSTHGLLAGGEPTWRMRV